TRQPAHHRSPDARRATGDERDPALEQPLVSRHGPGRYFEPTRQRRSSAGGTDMGRLDGKVALVTGAARGQGEAEARMFVAEGAKVVLGDVLDDLGEKIAIDLGDDARYVHLDVTKPDDWKAAVDTATSAFGKLDVLINNAGILKV